MPEVGVELEAELEMGISLTGMLDVWPASPACSRIGWCNNGKMDGWNGRMNATWSGLGRWCRDGDGDGDLGE
jgi:hypothetical protein